MYRQTAFECMGIRRYAEAEETIKDLFYKQTESLRRTILNALLEINGEHNVDFFCKGISTEIFRLYAAYRTALPMALWTKWT